MYRSIYNLRKAPFAMTPDPSAFYMSATHREALVGLTHAILSGKGFALLTGDAGMGKTTVTARMLQQLPPEKAKVSVVFNPTLTATEFLEMVLLNFGVDVVPASKPQRLELLRKVLDDAEYAGRIAVLVVDEAHKLSAELLEEVRLLGNFERPDKKLLQIVLAGQSELGELLEAPELWQLKQRFATRVHIARLSPADVTDYVQSRWASAGGASTHPFTVPALAAIAGASDGVPRVINAICENALLSALAEGGVLVAESHVRQARADLKIAAPGKSAHAPERLPHVSAEPEVGVPAAETVFAALDSYAAPPSLIRRWAAILGFAS